MHTHIRLPRAYWEQGDFQRFRMVMIMVMDLGDLIKNSDTKVCDETMNSGCHIEVYVVYAVYALAGH
jgi:hypothetical protein